VTAELEPRAVGLVIVVSLLLAVGLAWVVELQSWRRLPEALQRLRGLPRLACRRGWHDWKRWYSGWYSPDGVTYCLERCGRPGCFAVRSTSAYGLARASGTSPNRDPRRA